MAEPDDMILPLLREMRAKIDSNHQETLARLDAIEKTQASFRQALSADSLLSKLVTGDFEQRLEALEKQAREWVEAR